MSITPKDGAEKDLFTAVEKGRNYHAPDCTTTPAGVKSWTAAQAIRAEVIVALCTEAEVNKSGAGVRVFGAHITGKLDFEGRTLSVPLRLQDCLLDDQLVFRDADARTVMLIHSELPGIQAARARFRGALYLDRSECHDIIDLMDARIEGSLHASNATFRCHPDRSVSFSAHRLSVVGAAAFAKTRFEGQFSLQEASVGGGIYMEKAAFLHENKTAFHAPYLKCGELNLRAVECTGQMDLFEAQVGGNLILHNAGLRNWKGSCLQATGITVKSTVALKKVVGRGKMEFREAAVGDGFSAEDADLAYPGGAALDAPFMKCGEFNMRGAKVDGKLVLYGATVAGSLEFDKAKFISSQPVDAVIGAHGLTASGAVLFRNGFKSSGLIRIAMARIGGAVECRRASFGATNGEALNFDGTSIERAVSFREDCQMEGDLKLQQARVGDSLEIVGGAVRNLLARDCSIAVGIELNGCRIQGKLDLQGAKIGASLETTAISVLGADNLAINAALIQVAGNVRLPDASLNGELCLRHGHIGGDADLAGASLSGGTEFVLQASNLQLGGSLKLTGATILGGAELTHASIGGEIDCRNVTLSPGTEQRSFRAPHMSLSGGLFWENVTYQDEGTVDLRDSCLGTLYDDETSWTAGTKLRIAGLNYGAFKEASTGAHRLNWLRKQQHFNVEPYEQAIRTFRKMGQREDARLVAIAMQDDLRRSGKLSVLQLLWNYFLGSTIRHGYSCKPVLLIAAIVWICGVLIFQWGFGTHAIQPVKTAAIAGPNAYILPFSPFWYSADVFLPVINLHQEEYYLPVGPGQAFRIYFYAHILLGWICTTLFVAWFTGLMKKDL